MQSASRSWEPLEPWEDEAITAEAQAFLRTHDLRWSDLDDLRSESTLRWLQERSRYDPQRGASARTFLKSVVRNVCRDLLKAELAESRRGDRGAIRLGRPVVPGRDETFADVIPDPASDPGEGAGLRASLRHVLDRLSRQQQDLLQDRIAGFSDVEIAGRRGIHRATVSREFRRIRVVFNDAGLNE